MGDIEVCKKTNIKILIACHKPSELPKNNLFLPIRVGAEKAKDDLGLQRDDDGEDNISHKNPGYCELTAIYWAWKNLEADYYGLFHYRRYYSFSSQRYPVSDDGHMMVRARLLSPEVYDKFGLTDESQMRRIIEANDLIVHESRPVKDLPTPMGLAGKSVREHYIYHDGTIVRNSDIELMTNIVRDKYPAIYPYYQKYLDGNFFLGYNMFIMKKQFFTKMCQFEFDVLEEVEKTLSKSLSQRSLNANRVYGYLAEILTSVYIYYLRQTIPGLKVKELQMIYALKTDPVSRYDIEPLNDQSIPVAFDLMADPISNADYYFQAVLAQFIDNCSSKRKYDVIVAHSGTLSELCMSEYLKCVPDNINLRFLDYSNSLNQLYELKGIGNISLKLTLPWVLKHYDRIIYLSWHSWVKGDVNDLLSLRIKDNEVAACQNMFTMGRLVEVNCDKRIPRIKLLTDKLKLDVAKYFDTNVMLIDLAQIRQRHSLDDVISEYNSLHQEFSSEDIFNYLYGKVELIGQQWNYQIPTGNTVNHIGNFFTPIKLYQEWNSTKTSYKIGQFVPQSIVNGKTMFMLDFYKVMSSCSLWMLLVISRKDTSQRAGRSVSLRDRIAPVGSLRRTLIRTLLPSGSRLRTMGGKIYRRVRS